jgi:hypothetical protein
MKTHKLSLTFRWAATTYIAMVFGVQVSAQPAPEMYESNEVSEAFMRLEILMASADLFLKYEAPVMDEDYEIAMDRLELLAEKSVMELKYQAPDFNDELSLEYAKEDNVSVTDFDTTAMSHNAYEK